MKMDSKAAPHVLEHYSFTVCLFFPKNDTEASKSSQIIHKYQVKVFRPSHKQELNYREQNFSRGALLFSSCARDCDPSVFW